jgi:hypothetical protein
MSNPLNLGTKIMIDSIREELESMLSGNVLNESIVSVDNPIEFENDIGKFKYEGNGRLLVQPKKGVEYLVLNVDILPTGEAN